MDPNPDLGRMDVTELVEFQQGLTRQRLEVNEAQRRAQAELDRRRREIADRRAAEDELLGQQTKPPTQDLFGDSPPELVAGDPEDGS